MKKTLLTFLTIATMYGVSHAQVVINELQSSNDATVLDEAEEYDDWIELHNTGSEAANVGGMILKDSGGEWTIPSIAAANIPAGGYLLIWADKDEDQGDFHASFKLSGSEGEDLGLYQSDGETVVDMVSFPAVETDKSYARCSGDWLIVSTPTPGAENNCTVGTQILEASSAFYVFPTLTAGKVSIEAKNSATVLSTVELYSMTGQQLATFDYSTNNTSIDLSNYANGMYVLMIKTADATFSQKITIAK